MVRTAWNLTSGLRSFRLVRVRVDLFAGGFRGAAPTPGALAPEARAVRRGRAHP